MNERAKFVGQYTTAALHYYLVVAAECLIIGHCPDPPSGSSSSSSMTRAICLNGSSAVDIRLPCSN